MIENPDMVACVTTAPKRSNSAPALFSPSPTLEPNTSRSWTTSERITCRPPVDLLLPSPFTLSPSIPVDAIAFLFYLATSEGLSLKSALDGMNYARSGQEQGWKTPLRRHLALVAAATCRRLVWY